MKQVYYHYYRFLTFYAMYAVSVNESGQLAISVLAFE